MSEVRQRRGAGAEEGAGDSGSKEVVMVVGLFGTVVPLELGECLVAGGGHLGLMPAQLNKEQSELLRLSGTIN